MIDSNIARFNDAERKIRKDAKFALRYFSPDVIDEMCAHLEKIVDRPSVKENGEFRWTRDLNPTEEAFVQNEKALCALDWRHFCENYVQIELASQSDRPEGFDLLNEDRAADHKKGGPVGKFILNGMQIALLHKLGELEEIAFDQAAKGLPVNGILLILLKSRQLGASTQWQCLLRHRVNFFSNYPTLSASIDQDNTELLHRRSERMYDKLPTWMKAIRKRKTIDGGEEFINGSMINLQNFKQDKDLGKGETWRGFHGTELSSVSANRYEDHVEEGLFHAIPNDRRVLYGMESTARGKTGPWYDFCMQVMSNTAEGGAGRFSSFFGPFYMIDVYEQARGQRSKCRMEVPDGWVPDQNTVRVAERVRETSPEFMPDHQRVDLPLEVLRWYEVTRSMFYRRGKLNLFLQAYPIEPSEAFQHGSAGAFTTETIERLNAVTADYEPWPYRIVTEEEIDDVKAYVEDLTITPIHQVGGYYLAPMHPAELDRDARGIIFIFEQPDARHEYHLSADPTAGIPKWSRAFRQHNDINIDNASLDIYRKNRSVRQCEDCHGLGWLPTGQPNAQIECRSCDGRGKIGGRGVQVLQFAAPIDAEEFALYIWVLGKLYRGKSDLDECNAIIENNNTGILTIRTLQNKYQYTNLWQSQSVAQGENVKLLNAIGWHSHPSTVPVLHARGRIAIVRRDIEIRSKHTVRELSDAITKIVGQEMEKTKSIVSYERFIVPPGGGRHDDRMTTTFLACFVLFDWSDMDDSETSTESALRELPTAKLAPDASAGMQARAWNDAAEALFGQYDLNFGHHDDCDISCRADHASEDQIEEDQILGSVYDDEDDDGIEFERGPLF